MKVWIKSLSVTIQMKAIKQHFYVVMFVFNVIFYSLTKNGKSRAKLLLHMALSVQEWVLTILPSWVDPDRRALECPQNKTFTDPYLVFYTKRKFNDLREWLFGLNMQVPLWTVNSKFLVSFTLQGTESLTQSFFSSVFSCWLC